MDYRIFLPYLLVMALSTYFIRVIPFILIRHKIENKFIKSFLHYVPYTVLAAMTVPAVFYGTEHLASGIIGFIVAVIAASKTSSLIKVALSMCIAVFAIEMLYTVI